MTNILLACLLSYLIGSIPFGLLIARLYGVDIRNAGSGNIGATNVGRQLGRRVGLIVFLLDFAKGAGPVAVARQFSGESTVSVLCGIFALLGHMFPIWLRFRGGKGVATGTGVVAVLMPIPSLLGAAAWLAVVSSLRFVSLGSIIAGAVVCAVYLTMTSQPFADDSRAVSSFAIGALALVCIRHFNNITRLLAGRENRLEESKTMRMVAKIIHVLAVGLWFGSNVFFTLIAAVVIFKTWENLGESSFNERPHWLPLNASFNKEGGTRIAGATVGPIFPLFFFLQGVCALLALVTAVGFSRWQPERKVHRVRFYVILLAALTVIVGWPLAQQVGELRSQRFALDESIATPAKEKFGQLHAASLLLNFGTIGLLTIGCALTASLPATKSET